MSRIEITSTMSIALELEAAARAALPGRHVVECNSVWRQLWCLLQPSNQRPAPAPLRLVDCSTPSARS
jgi:hypothetical protein